MKYFLYARKSTEEEERQALSLETQLEKAREVFASLDIIEMPPESASAFTPNNRPIFQQMLDRIDSGEAHGIIAWHPDRLSRNELDAAAITYRVRTGKILDLKFGSYTFDNSPEGIMMLQMTMSQSQYSSAKLSKDVKRGNEKKIKMGWKPGCAPTGYLNTPDLEKGSRIIVIDPERFTLVRKKWDLILTGNYTVPEVLNIASEDWGFTTRKTRKMGGGPLSRSALYGMFTNPFYAGVIRYNGEIYDGSHEAMVSLAEYDRVQSILGRKGKPRPKTHKITYRGPIMCGECECMITAEVHGRGKDMKIYIHPYPVNARQSHMVTMETSRHEYAKVRSKGLHLKIFIENVGYQYSAVQQLQSEGVDAEGVPVGSLDKRGRLTLISYMFEEGRILFPKTGCNELIMQLTGFGKEKHDDLVDAITIVITKLVELSAHREPSIRWL